jgi:hypothetical protein
MATLPSNEFKDLLFRKIVDLDNDTVKIALMAAGFSFARATHNIYADISASELGTANGYTVGGASLTGSTITRNDTTNEVDATFNNASWTATGGDIEAQGAILYDTTVVSPVVSPVIGYIDFGGSQIAYVGAPFVVANIKITI